MLLRCEILIMQRLSKCLLCCASSSVLIAVYRLALVLRHEAITESVTTESVTTNACQSDCGASDSECMSIAHWSVSAGAAYLWALDGHSRPSQDSEAQPVGTSHRAGAGGGAGASDCWTVSLADGACGGSDCL